MKFLRNFQFYFKSDYVSALTHNQTFRRIANKNSCSSEIQICERYVKAGYFILIIMRALL